MGNQPLQKRESLLVLVGIGILLIGALIFLGLIFLLKKLGITEKDVALGKAFVTALVGILPGVIALIVARGRVTPVDPKTNRALNPAVKPAGE